MEIGSKNYKTNTNSSLFIFLYPFSYHPSLEIINIDPENRNHNQNNIKKREKKILALGSLVYLLPGAHCQVSPRGYEQPIKDNYFPREDTATAASVTQRLLSSLGLLNGTV